MDADYCVSWCCSCHRHRHRLHHRHHRHHSHNDDHDDCYWMDYCWTHVLNHCCPIKEISIDWFFLFCVLFSHQFSTHDGKSSQYWTVWVCFAIAACLFVIFSLWKPPFIWFDASVSQLLKINWLFRSPNYQQSLTICTDCINSPVVCCWFWASNKVYRP